jgi:hypothetical protein
LKKSSTDVVMWANSQKGGSQYVVSTSGTTITSDETLWAEYVNFGGNTCTLTLIVIDTISGLELFTEELVYRPFNSVTVAFVGENEIAGDPVTSPGINDWVIQELLDGYDVHVYDDGYDVFGNPVVDCNKWGEGTALNEVANAVNNRGVNDVAILGYSHGGGSTYNLSWRMYYDGKTSDSYLYWNPPQVIFNSYNLVFTSYIDAVPNNFSLNGALRTSLVTLPLGTEFHTNQYQENSWINGCSVSGSDDDIDRSYLGVEHSGGGELGIDTNTIVQGFLTTRFRQKVNR